MFFGKNKKTKKDGEVMIRQASLFSQLVAIFNRNEFNRMVKKHGSERYSKGFESWDQFVSMLFCQFAQAKSIREICNGLSCCVGKLKHLGMKSAPSKSTLSYVNANRPWEMFQDLFYETLVFCRKGAPLKHKFRFKNKLLSLDSSTISLCLSLFPWAKFRQKKGAVKLHLLLDHDGYLPTFAYISDGKKHDVKVARHVPLAPGSIVAMDRGYNDYKLFCAWTEAVIYFVTRLKENADYIVLEDRKVPENRDIIQDQLIKFAGHMAQKNCPHVLRRVVVWDAEKDREIVLLTNHLEFGATTISSIYKDRWQIELFFKAIKQNLKIKTFVGTSENALSIQIWTALITMLLIKYLRFKAKYGWSLSNLVALLRWNLFTYRDLWEWLDNPFKEYSKETAQIQLELPFRYIGQHLKIRTT